MKAKIFSIIIGSALLFAASAQLGAVTFHRVVTNATICKPMFPAQNNLVEYKSWGLRNTTMNQDIWVGCPFIQVQDATTEPAVFAVIDMVNQNKSEVEGSCLFREVDTDGDIIQTKSVPFTLPALGKSNAAILTGLDNADNSFTFSCKLMRNTFISRIFHYVAQS